MIQDRVYFKVGQRKQAQKCVSQEEESFFDIYDEEIEEIVQVFKRLAVNSQEEQDDLNKKSRLGELKNFDLTPQIIEQMPKSKCEEEFQQNQENDYEMEGNYTNSTTDDFQDDVLYYQCDEINYVQDLNEEKNSVKQKKVQMKRNQKKSIDKEGISKKISKQKH